VHHPERTGPAAAARIRQRLPEDAAAGREDPGRAGRIPVQGLLGPDEHRQADFQDGHARQPQHVPGRDDRPRPGRHPVHVRSPRHRVGAQMSTPTYTCPWCRIPSAGADATCPHCGAPIDVRARVSKSGWAEQPPIRHMARIRFNRSTCQISGTYVPVAEMNLHDEDWVYFSHHVLLHTDPQVRLDTLKMKGGWNRVLAGMPLIMMTARGPGHIAFSADHPGDTLVVPLQAHQAVDVTEHHFLVATGNVNYQWESSRVWFATQDGDDQEYHYPLGRTMDRFSAHGAPGRLLLHAP